MPIITPVGSQEPPKVLNPCPEMTKTHAVLVPGGMPNSLELKILTVEVECNRERCPVWANGNCGKNISNELDFLRLAVHDVRGALDDLRHLSNLEPPRSGPSPSMRTAESLETIVALLTQMEKARKSS